MDKEKTVINMDKKILSTKAIKMNHQAYVSANSVYYEEDNERRIDKSEMAASRIAKEIKGASDKTIKKSLDKMLEMGVVIYDEKRKVYIVPDVDKNFVLVKRDTLNKLIRTFNNEITQIYLWLKNNQNMWRSKGQNFCFSKKQIAEMLGLDSKSAINYRHIEEYLTQLIINGLISYKIVRKGKTYYRELIFISDDFIISDAIIKNVDNITKQMEEINKNILDDKFEDGESISIGYNEQILNKIQSGDIKVLEEPIKKIESPTADKNFKF